MSNLQKYQPTVSVQIQTRFGVLNYDAPANLTKEQNAILAAYTAPKIDTVSDMELDAFLLRQINQALLLLGHTRQLQTPEEQTIMSDAIASLIREKYSFLTLQDLELVFQMATRGEFKNSPEDVVMVNLEKVSSWIKAYHRKIRADVIASLKPAEPKKERPEDYNPETDFEALLQKLKTNQPVTETEWICQTAQHYDRLNKENVFGITLERRREIYAEEKVKLIENGKNKMLHINTETRFLFRAFMENQPGQNSYEKEVATNCKLRVFREYVEQLAKSKAA